jgi:glycine/D-amino acid oxidase-like deaminating enzyme
LLTARRDLRTGVPIWQSGRIQSTSPDRLATDIRTDVVVVGAGISGALIAEMLASDGHEVVVVDRRGPAKGSTAASTALVQYEIDEPLTLLATMIGKADATRAWRRSHQAVAGLIARTTELAISCQFERHSSLYLAGDMLNAEGIEREHAARADAGFETKFLNRAQLRERFGIARAAALLDFGNFAADPRRLTGGYLQEAIGAGARLFAYVEIVDVKAGSTEVVSACQSPETSAMSAA